MAELTQRQRAKLPESAFAYIDSRGRRRLPIHDEAHVRNALARFEQVRFEDDAARERARKRLLAAARRFGIVPIGFVDGQLRTERRRAEVAARTRPAAGLPRGVVTLMLTDIEDSTGLVRRLGDDYAAVLEAVRATILRAVEAEKGTLIDARADESYSVFGDARSAVAAAVTIQRALAARAWPGGERVRVRIGLHTGEPTITDAGYVGLVVHTAARICSAGHGGQIVLSRATRDALTAPAETVAAPEATFEFRDLGAHRLHGLPDPEALFQLVADGLDDSFGPPRILGTTAASDPVPAA